MEYKKVATFKDLAQLRKYLDENKIKIDFADSVNGATARPIECFDRTVGNRWAILPMEGWDCQDDGSPSSLTLRRWRRFAESGAKLLCGTEAAAVMHTGRSNPQQLMASHHTARALKDAVAMMRRTHAEKFGSADDMLIGLQLTHSGRYSHPNKASRREPRTAWAHPLLDKKFGCDAANVVSDAAVMDIVDKFIEAAVIAQDAGFDFVDIKQAHGYLGHEFLSAFERSGPYGGSFENRTRFVREILEGIRARCPELNLAVRLSIFDMIPFEKGPDGVGKPMEWQGSYPFAFGGSGDGENMDPDLVEPVRLVKMLREYGVRLICATCGSPYYNVHLQRPAYYPVCDGYLPPQDPLYNVSRQIIAVKRLRELCPGIPIVASGLTCLQEFLPYAAEHLIEAGETDFIGIGRMVLSYPELPADLLAGRPLNRSLICRTFGECTNAPRHGCVSGCYPLDHFYKDLIQKQEFHPS